MSVIRRSRSGRAIPTLELDFESGTWSPEERSQVMRRYEVYHGTGDTRLAKFAPFEIDHNPAGFKRYRQYLTKIGVAAGRMPGVSAAAFERFKGVLMIHLYAAIGNGPGCLYEIIGYRMHGLTKRQIQETLAFAFLNGGAFHTNDIAEAVSVYLDAWQEDDDPDAEQPPFPEGWKTDPGVFRSGIDVSRDGMSSSDVAALKAWYERMGGGVPPHVELWSELHPEAFKPQRARFEASLGETLPAQLYPLMQLLHAAYMGWPGVARRAMLWAQTLGVKREYAVTALELAFMYGGESRMEAVLTEEAARILLRWKT